MITTPVPVPAFVTFKPVALPLLVKLNDVGVVRPDANVKLMSRPSVVVILLPVL